MQVGHACLEAGGKFKQPEETIYLVVLQVDNKDKLLEAFYTLDYNNIKAVMFDEPDDNMGYTAFCTEPLAEDQRKYFKKYQLWK